jgi:glycosyltransferase involved in cell wall biosynthesis
VSAIIPTHDRLTLLSRSMQSVLDQTLPATELIVVDDVGNPEVEALVLAVARGAAIPVSYVDAKDLPVKAAGASRNAGAAVATGDLLAFLDDDDYWSETYLERAAALRAAEGSELIITAGYNSIDGRLEPGVTPTPSSIKGIRAGMTGTNMIVTRGAFDAVSGFDPNMWVLNDVDLFIRLRAAGTRIGIVSDRLIVQEGRGVGHLSSRSERRAQGLERFLKKHRPVMRYIDVRSIQGRIHRARTSPDHSRAQRIYHTIALCFYTKPSGYYQTIKRRVLLRPPMH